MPLQIPVTNAPRQSLLATLGEQACRLAIRWSPSAALWYLDLDVQGERIATGRQVTTRSRLIRTPTFFGDIYVRGPALESPPPGRMAWTEGWLLYYLTDAEVAASPPWL